MSINRRWLPSQYGAYLPSLKAYNCVLLLPKIRPSKEFPLFPAHAKWDRMKIEKNNLRDRCQKKTQKIDKVVVMEKTTEDPGNALTKVYF